MSFTATKLVVPVDFSEQSTNAIKVALEIAGDPSKLHLVHVALPLDTIVTSNMLGGEDDDVEPQSTMLQRLSQIANENGAANAVIAVLSGNPGEQISGYAKEHNADIIVISSHGYHGIKRMVLGSVAEKVIRHAECSVLVLRRADAE